ncbi:unnamed protein product [Trichobilharzia szidati]|nr:unnamed protein product [Trichobilharzia szidati]
MPSHHLRRVILADVGLGWKTADTGQTKTWYHSLKSLTVSSSDIGRRRLSDLGPQDAKKRWLKTFGGMVQTLLSMADADAFTLLFFYVINLSSSHFCLLSFFGISFVFLCVCVFHRV